MGRCEPRAAVGTQSSVFQHGGQRIGAVSLVGRPQKEFAHDLGFFRVDLQVLDRLAFLVDAALIDRAVAIVYRAARIVATGIDLPDAGRYPLGGLF